VWCGRLLYVDWDSLRSIFKSPKPNNVASSQASNATSTSPSPRSSGDMQNCTVQSSTVAIAPHLLVWFGVDGFRGYCTVLSHRPATMVVQSVCPLRWSVCFCPYHQSSRGSRWVFGHLGFSIELVCSLNGGVATVSHDDTGAAAHSLLADLLRHHGSKQSEEGTEHRSSCCSHSSRDRQRRTRSHTTTHTRSCPCPRATSTAKLSSSSAAST
jgi:hypothetical protein